MPTADVASGISPKAKADSTTRVMDIRHKAT
jgi:hypothetical protein